MSIDEIKRLVERDLSQADFGQAPNVNKLIVKHINEALLLLDEVSKLVARVSGLSQDVGKLDKDFSFDLMDELGVERMHEAEQMLSGETLEDIDKFMRVLGIVETLLGELDKICKEKERELSSFGTTVLRELKDKLKQQ